MKQTTKDIFAIIGVLLALIIIAFLLALAQPHKSAPEAGVNDDSEATTSEAVANDQGQFGLDQCGIYVQTKDNERAVLQSFKVNGFRAESLSFGDPRKPNLVVTCEPRGTTQVNADIETMLEINADTPVQVDPATYKIFSSDTIARIPKLFNRVGSPISPGTETIGFEDDRYVYELYFLYPARALDQGSYVITYNPANESSAPAPAVTELDMMGTWSVDESDYGYNEIDLSITKDGQKIYQTFISANGERKLSETGSWEVNYWGNLVLRAPGVPIPQLFSGLKLKNEKTLTLTSLGEAHTWAKLK